MSPAFVEEDLGTVVEAREYLDLRMDPILDSQGREFIPVDLKTRCDGLNPSSCPIMSALLDVQTRFIILDGLNHGFSSLAMLDTS